MSTTRQHGDLFRPSINKNEDRDLRGLFHWEEHDAKADMKEAASYGCPTAQVRLANNQRVRERITERIRERIRERMRVSRACRSPRMRGRSGFQTRHSRTSCDKSRRSGHRRPFGVSKPPQMQMRQLVNGVPHRASAEGTLFNKARTTEGVASILATASLRSPAIPSG